MEFIIIFFFDEIVMGLGYLIMAGITITAVSFILSNIVKILFVIIGIIAAVKIIQKTGKIGAWTIVGIVSITLANITIAEHLYYTSPNYRYSADSKKQITLVRCVSDFHLREIEIQKGDILALTTLTGHKDWSTGVDLYSDYKSSFYVKENIDIIVNLPYTTTIEITTKPVVDDLDKNYKILKTLTDDEVKELINQIEQDLVSMNSSSRQDQTEHFRDQIVGRTFSDIKNGSMLTSGVIKERTILEFDEDTVHITVGKYRCVINNKFGFNWDEISIISETTTSYTLERTVFGGLVVKTPSRKYKVSIDDTFTVKYIEIYDD